MIPRTQLPIRTVGQRRRHPLRLLLLFVLLSFLAGRAWGQGPGPRLQISGIDRSRFPELGVNLIATGEESRPLDDFDGLRLRENGVPISDFTVRPVTIGVDLVFVIDANAAFNDTEDESGLTRLQKVRDSILFYSGRYMDVAGRDRVAVIVSGDGKGQILVDSTTDPGTLIDAVRTYQPERDAQAPLAELLSLALEQMGAVPDGDSRRFQAVVLLTDGASANQFLFPPLVDEAQDASVSFFVLLLGAGVNENTVEALATLYEPTRGLLVHMPNVSASDALFDVVEANATQTQLRYHSNLVASGIYPISVGLGAARDEYTFDLSLAPPQVTLALEDTTIRRVGLSADAALEELQPAVQSIPAAVTWPDEMPRAIVAATLLADGKPQEATLFGDSEALEFDWDISERSAGQYVLTAVITDSIGLTARSEPRPLTIVIARPELRATPAATPTPVPGILERIPTIVIERRVLELGGAFLGVIVLLFLWWRRRRKRVSPPRDAEPVPVLPPAPPALYARGKITPENGADATPSAILEPMSPDKQPLLLRGINITLGRDPIHADALCDDPSVAPLHARLRWHDGRYWLYDEGSASGTYLNYERLGLAPRALADGDVIQLGRIRFRFRLLEAQRASGGS